MALYFQEFKQSHVELNRLMEEAAYDRSSDFLDIASEVWEKLDSSLKSQMENLTWLKKNLGELHNEEFVCYVLGPLNSEVKGNWYRVQQLVGLLTNSNIYWADGSVVKHSLTKEQLNDCAKDWSNSSGPK